jgi:hypothetical protein
VSGARRPFVTQRVTISDLTITGNVLALPEALFVADSLGDVMFEGCRFVGADADASAFLGRGYAGVRVTSSAAVSFAGCILEGGAGLDQFFTCPADADNGGAGLSITSSNVSVQESQIEGGEGGLAPGCSVAGVGGAAITASGGLIFVGGSTLSGGAGGLNFSSCACRGDGGTALSLNGTQAELLDVELVPGQPNPASFVGVPGLAVVAQGGGA